MKSLSSNIYRLFSHSESFTPGNWWRRVHFVAFWGVWSCAFAQPWQPEVIWDRSGIQDSSAYGYKILPLGDQNDDGFADWAVVAAGNFSRGGANRGTQHAYIEFFRGGLTLSTTPHIVVPETTAIFSFDPAKILGDINGDGYVDYYFRSSQINNPGYDELRIYRGDLDTVSLLTLTVLFDDLIRLVGDFNGDHFDDFAIYHTTDLYDYVEVFFGASIPDSIADWRWFDQMRVGQEPLPRGIGDVNGDEYSDIIGVAGRRPEHIVVLLGSSTPDTVIDYEWTEDAFFYGAIHDLNADHHDEMYMVYDGAPVIAWGRDSLRIQPDYSPNFPCDYGPGAANLGDINRDGFNDLALLTGYCSNQWFGVLAVYLGSTWINPQPALVVEGSGPPYNFVGISGATGLGDVNGDGIDDWAVGSYDDFATEGFRGRVVIFAGDSTVHTGVEDRTPPLAQELSLSVFPNPFNAETTFELRVSPYMGVVKLSVFDLLGRVVFEQQFEPISATFSLHYSGQDNNGFPLSTGLYFLRAAQANQQTTTKLIVLK